MTRPAATLRAGRVGRPHGLDGSFYVSQPKSQLLFEGAMVIVSGRTLRITRRGGDERRPFVRVEGCEDRPAAEALRGEELRVARTDAPELGPDEWWPEDLEGCVVQSVRGQRAVGTVRRLISLPSVEVLEVERDDGGGEVLVPLVSDVVRQVDVARGEIEVDLRFLGLED